MSLIVAEDLSKSYDTNDVTVDALKRVSFAIEPRAFVSFVGPRAAARQRRETLTASGDDRLLQQALRAAESGYARITPMRTYLYGRASQPDAFGVLYLGAGVAAILNLDDHSFSLTPEISYKAGENLELRSQAGLLVGRRDTEFGEKQANVRFEIRARYYF